MRNSLQSPDEFEVIDAPQIKSPASKEKIYFQEDIWAGIKVTLRNAIFENSENLSISFGGVKDNRPQNHPISQFIARLQKCTSKKISTENIEQEIDEYVAQLFEKLDKAYLQRTSREEFYNSAECNDVKYALMLTGKLVPIVATDWLVNRKAAAEENCGIKNLRTIQKVLAEEYSDQCHYDAKTPNQPRFRTLEKGPGNAQALYELNLDSENEPPHFENHGICDKLYYPITISQFIKPEALDETTQQLVRFIDLLLCKELKKRWYEAKGNIIGEWIPKQTFFDNNEIYKLLADFSAWLPAWIGKDQHQHRWFDHSKGSFIGSQEFEDDQKNVKLSLEVHRLFLQIILENEDPLVRKEEIHKILEPRVKRLLKDQPQTLATEVSEETNMEIFHKIFTQEFVEGISDAKLKENQFSKADIPDLNHHTSVYFENIRLGYFTELDQHYPENSMMFVYASRSDSHETDEMFVEDLRRFLTKNILKPGGILLTDGLRASYTRERRERIVAKLMEEFPEYKASIVIKGENLYPASLVIQRNHPKGFLSKKREQEILHNDAYFEPLDIIAERADLRIFEVVRKRIKEVAKGHVEVFKNLHEDLKNVMNEELIVGARKRLISQGENGNYSDAEILKIIRSCELLLSQQELDTIISKIYAAMDRLEFAKESLMNKKRSQAKHTMSPHIVTFLKPNLLRSTYNEVCTFNPSELPPNKFSPEVNDQINAKISQIVERIVRLAKKLGKGKKPISFLSSECKTNDFLYERLRTLFGRIPNPNPHASNPEENFYAYHFIEKIELQMRASEGKGNKIEELDKLNRSIDDVRGKLENVFNDGGVIIAGGDWGNPDDPPHATHNFYTKEIGKLILEALNDRNSRITMAAICFFSEIMAEAIGEKYWDGKIKAVSGAFVIGPDPMALTPAGLKDPIFAGLNPEMTFFSTHSYHPHDFTDGKAANAPNPRHSFIPIIKSTLFDKDSGWSGCDGDLKMLVFHPEFSMYRSGSITSDLPRLYRQLRALNTSLKNTFQIDADSIVRNFLHAFENGEYSMEKDTMSPNLIQHHVGNVAKIVGKPKSRLQSDAGQNVLINMLDELLRRAEEKNH